MLPDPAETRDAARRRWGGAARGWDARADEMRRNTMPVSAWLVEAIRPQPGHVVLELAAGVGDTGLLAAELIQPGGVMICSDFAPEMLTSAQARARALGIANVRFKQIDAEQPIDLATASVDAVLCRWGYMLLSDPEAALRETRRVLRPGGRLALAAWAEGDDNPASRLPARIAVERALVGPAAPDAPGMFAWAAEGRVADVLAAAGFVEFEVRDLRFTWHFDSFEDWWAYLLDTSLTFVGAIAPLSEDERAAVREEVRAAAREYTAPDGKLALPARTWVAAATA